MNLYKIHGILFLLFILSVHLLYFFSHKNLFMIFYKILLRTLDYCFTKLPDAIEPFVTDPEPPLPPGAPLIERIRWSCTSNTPFNIHCCRTRCIRMIKYIDTSTSRSRSCTSRICCRSVLLYHLIQ